MPRTPSRTRSKKKNSRSQTCYIFKSYLFFLRDTAVSAFNSFGFIRVCAAEPRPDFRYRLNANDGKARLCRVFTRGLAPKRKQQVSNLLYFQIIFVFFTRYGRFRLRFFLFVRICAAEPRPDFRCRSNANDGKAKLCRVLTRGLAPNKKEQAKPVLFCLERETRFELATFALARQRSTTEPFPHSGGNNRARTYDPLLVRQMLSQLSYAPVTLNAYIL